MRKFTVHDAEQRSEAWFLARCGRLTASSAKDMLSTIKSGEAAARRDLRVRLVCERLTGQPQEDAFVNDAMRRGTELEPEAFAAYEAVTGQMARRVGFLAHTEHLAGGSPDGVIGDFDGLVELKCPKSPTHFGYLKAGTVPAEHLAQITHLLWLTGCAYVDFLSYDPRFPSELQTFHVRVTAGDVDLKTYESKALAFLAEVERDLLALKTITELPTVLKEASVA